MPDPQDLDESIAALARALPKGDGEHENEFWKAPDLLETVSEGSLPLGQILGPREAEEFRSLLSGLIGLFVARQAGDERSGWQLDVVRKFVFPQKYEVPWTVVESLAKKYESGHLIRGWALRRLMYELADLVELAQPGLEDVTASVVRISPDADPRHRHFDAVQSHCKSRTTLQSLAIQIYLDLVHQQDADAIIDERSLRRDLKRLKAWEDSDPVHTRLKKEYAAARTGHHWKTRIPVRLYSESFRPATPGEIEEGDIVAALRAEEREE